MLYQGNLEAGFPIFASNNFLLLDLVDLEQAVIVVSHFIGKHNFFNIPILEFLQNIFQFCLSMNIREHDAAIAESGH
jgi:hypothetical protein